MHVLSVGCRWQDHPKDYCLHKTIYNRFSRYSEREAFGKRSSSLSRGLPNRLNKPPWKQPRKTPPLR